MKKINRNDLCHCGSGKKYKNCHVQRDESIIQTLSKTPAIFIVAVVLVIGLVVTILDNGSTQNQSPGTAPPGKVWSVEHGHWHDIVPNQQPNQSGPPFAQPPGSTPPGKVWSPEHGHWHDI